MTILQILCTPYKKIIDLYSQPVTLFKELICFHKAQDKAAASFTPQFPRLPLVSNILNKRAYHKNILNGRGSSGCYEVWVILAFVPVV
jgi:hypothetical protein